MSFRVQVSHFIFIPLRPLLSSPYTKLQSTTRNAKNQILLFQKHTHINETAFDLTCLNKDMEYSDIQELNIIVFVVPSGFYNTPMAFLIFSLDKNDYSESRFVFLHQSPYSIGFS